MSLNVQNVMAWFAGAVVSIPANMLLLEPMGKLLGAPPAPTVMPDEDPEAWARFIASLDAVHMVGPLVAHWNGALMGAAVAGMLAADRGMTLPLAVASFVMLGGVLNAVMLPGQPVPFLVIDLAGYLPMGWLGWQLALHLRPLGR